MRPAAFALVLAVALPAAAQDPTLKWNLKAGDTFYAKTVAENDMTVEVMGQTLPMKQTVTGVLKLKVTAASADSRTVELTYVDMKMDLGVPVPGVGEIGEKFKGATLTATLDNDLKVTKLEGFDKFADKVTGDDPVAKQVMTGIVNQDTLKQTFGQIFLPLPAGPAKPGESWAREEKVPFSGFGTMTVKRTFTLEGEKAGVATIKEAADITFKAGDGAKGGLPFEIKAGELNVKDYKATHEFDVKAGRLKGSKQSMDLSGKMSVAAMGQTIDMGLKGTNRTTVTVTDKAPASAAAD
jgi:hypothetical protein